MFLWGNVNHKEWYIIFSCPSWEWPRLCSCDSTTSKGANGHAGRCTTYETTIASNFCSRKTPSFQTRAFHSSSSGALRGPPAPTFPVSTTSYSFSCGPTRPFACLVRAGSLSGPAVRWVHEWGCTISQPKWSSIQSFAAFRTPCDTLYERVYGVNVLRGNGGRKSWGIKEWKCEPHWLWGR